jgi:hypothetical protein
MMDKNEIQIEEKNDNAEDLAKVEAQAAAKLLRGRVDDYIAIITAVSAVALLWLLQFLGFY